MNSYAHFSHKDFYIALGYKAELVKEYFLNYHYKNSDFSVSLDTGKITTHHSTSIDWNLTLIDTGINTMTGGRVKKLQSYIGDEPFLLTYGDGVSNIDINKLIDFHKSHGKMVTVSAVRPAARFGELEISEDKQVISFEEKPQLNDGWINGGFFVIEPEFFNLIDGDDTLLEREPLERAAKAGELMAFKHYDFWHCMDTKRDHELLESLYVKGAPWTV